MLKKTISLFLVFSLVFLLFGCAERDEEITEGTTLPSEVAFTENRTNPNVSISAADTQIILDDERTSVRGEGAVFSEGVLTISKAGTYSISGKLSDGYIYVNTQEAEKKVKLLFCGIDIYSSKEAPVYVASSPKETQIILEEGSINNLSDNADRVLSEEIVSDEYSKAVIYSKDDLQIEGNGTLNITANFEKGIFSKDDLQIKGGIINISSKDDAVRGKDSVEISDSTVTLTAKGDGIRSSNETDEGKGDITITNSTLDITSDLDGIQSVKGITVSNSNIRIITAGGASEDMTSAPEDFRGGFGGPGGRPDPFGEENAKDESAPSAKGLKSKNDMFITNSVITVNSVDDALHSDKNLTSQSSTVTVKTNDDGIHSELLLTLKNSTVNTEFSYEGLEAQEIALEGSTIDIVSADDGLNAAAAEEQSENPAFSGEELQKQPPENGFPFGDKGGRGDMGGMGGFGEYNENCQIKINSSTLCIKAEGDGIDSNGDIAINGSTIAVYGPVNGGNGSLDYGGKCITKGSNLIAAGSSGMAQKVSEGSDPSLSFTCGISADTLLTVTDEDGNDIIAFCSPKQYSCVVFSSYKLQKGKTYTVYEGGTNNGTDIFGILSGDKTKNATVLGSLEAS